MAEEILRKRAEKLRANGMSVLGLSKLLGITRDKARQLLKDITTQKEEPTVEMMDEMKKKSRCAFCGGRIEGNATGRPKRFCCNECRRDYWHLYPAEGKRNDKAIYTIKCRWCNKTFTAYGNRNRKYCCHEHYIRDRFGEPEER